MPPKLKTELAALSTTEPITALILSKICELKTIFVYSFEGEI